MIVVLPSNFLSGEVEGGDFFVKPAGLELTVLKL